MKIANLTTSKRDLKTRISEQQTVVRHQQPEKSALSIRRLSAAELLCKKPKFTKMKSDYPDDYLLLVYYRQRMKYF